MRRITAMVLLLGYLGLWGEHLALYENGRIQPLPYAAELYSQEDRRVLQEGIPYSSEAQRSSLLEDFTS